MALGVRMGMGARGMICHIARVAVGVEMHLARGVAVHMEMNARPANPDGPSEHQR